MNVLGRRNRLSRCLLGPPGRYWYGPFGELIRATGPLAKANPFRFSTKYQDDETDLLYYGYRYYNASTGRWIRRDPIGERGGQNIYAFAGNHPIVVYDVLGLFNDPMIENIGNDFGKCDDRGFWLGVSFKLDKGSAMLSGIQLSGSYTPCCGGTANPVSKSQFEFTTSENTFTFGNDQSRLERSMLHLANGEAKCKGYSGDITIVFEYSIVASSPVPPGFTTQGTDHGPSSPNKPPGWTATATHTIKCKWGCDGNGVTCTQEPSGGIEESGPDRVGAGGGQRK